MEDDCYDVGKGLGVVLKSGSPRPLEVAGLPTQACHPSLNIKSSPSILRRTNIQLFTIFKPCQNFALYRVVCSYV